MANMSYCKFRNTLKNLRDCEEDFEKNIYDPCDDPDEERARIALLKLCKHIMENQGDV